MFQLWFLSLDFEMDTSNSNNGSTFWRTSQNIKNVVGDIAAAQGKEKKINKKKQEMTIWKYQKIPALFWRYTFKGVFVKHWSVRSSD